MESTSREMNAPMGWNGPMAGTGPWTAAPGGIMGKPGGMPGAGMMGKPGAVAPWTGMMGKPGGMAPWGGMTGMPGGMAPWGGMPGMPGAMAPWGGMPGMPRMEEMAEAEEMEAPPQAMMPAPGMGAPVQMRVQMPWGMPPMQVNTAPVTMTGTATGGAGAVNVSPTTQAAAGGELKGAFRVPGFAVSMDTPLLQGHVNWPGWAGMFQLPSWMAGLHLPGVQAGAAGGDMQGRMMLPGYQVMLMPDGPADDPE